MVKEAAQACCAGDGKGGVLTCMVVTGRGDRNTNFKKEFKSKVLGTLGKKTEKYQYLLCSLFTFLFDNTQPNNFMARSDCSLSLRITTGFNSNFRFCSLAMRVGFL